MKWRPTLALWVVLFTPLTLYNIFGNPILFSTQSTQFSDPKVLNYNLSLSAPIRVIGNFSTSVALDKPVTNFRLRGYAIVSVNYQSYGAYGAYQLWVSVSENNFLPSTINQRMDFVLNPPIPPTGSGAILNGSLPDNVTREGFSHLIQGPNTISLNFTFFSTGINSTSYTPPNYGPGYFKLGIGPFVVKVTDLAVVYSLDAASELILAGLLFPVAHGIRIIVRRLRKGEA